MDLVDALGRSALDRLLRMRSNAVWNWAWPNPCTGPAAMDSFPKDPDPAVPIPGSFRTDADFDRLLPFRERRAACRFWTPIAVARRVAHVLGEHGARSVLDVGAGPGKFCIAAGLQRPEVRWTGIEQRPRLVRVARTLIRRFGVGNVDVRVGDAVGASWSSFDAFYFFNPFGENLFDDESDRVDSSVELSRRRFAADVSLAEQALERAAVGTKVATYYGFGGRIPGAFTPVHRERVGTDWLRLWVRTQSCSVEETWIEQPGGLASLGKWLTATSCASDG